MNLNTTIKLSFRIFTERKGNTKPYRDIGDKVHLCCATVVITIVKRETMTVKQCFDPRSSGENPILFHYIEILQRRSRDYVTNCVVKSVSQSMIY